MKDSIKPPNSELRKHRLGTICIILILMTVFLMAFHSIDESDLGFHLSMGRWITDNRLLPETDPLTYTVPDHEYIDLHWLYQIVVWYIWNLGAAPLIILFHALCVVTAFAIAMKSARKRDGSLPIIAFLSLLGALSSEIRFSTRPEVISWILLVLYIRILEANRKNQPVRLWLLPLMMLFWVNLQGIYVLGLGILACYLLDDLIRHRRIDQRLLKSSIATVLVCFCNPYGFRGILFPLLLSTRLHGDNRFALTIGEFLSPWSLNPLDVASGISVLLCSYYLMAVLIPLLLILTRKKRTPADWLITGMFWVLAAQALRNIPLYFLATLPIAASALNDLGTQLKFRFAKLANRTRRFHFAPCLLLVLTTTALSLMLLNGSWYWLTNRTVQTGTGISSDFLPVDAVDFLNRKNLDGRILNELRFGGYLSWRWGKPIFIDGRLEVMQQAFYDSYESARRIQIPWSLVATWRPDIALFSYTVLPGWFKQFLDSADWRLVHVDDHCSVFLRAGYREDVSALNPDEIATHSLNVTVQFPDLETARSILTSLQAPGKFRWISRLLYGLPDYPRGMINRSRVLLISGADASAELLMLQALDDTGGFYSIIWHHLAELYMKSGNDILAIKCLQAVLAGSPDDQNALLQMDRIRLRGSH